MSFPLLPVFESRPYKLHNKVQNYPWGSKNDAAYIPSLLGITTKPNTPYAELWIGAHPKAPSAIEIDNKAISLDKLIDEFPVECLGKNTAKKFSNKLPFLLKVLSAESVLSIQTHPNKMQAEKLHKKDPVNYPDTNHKPEIAIAIDNLTAIVGFKPVKEIISTLKSMPELIEFIGAEFIEKVFSVKEKKKQEKLIRSIYSAILMKSGDTKKLEECINRLLDRFTNKDIPTLEEVYFLNYHKKFGNDIGLLSFFFFNLVQLESGQAIFTGAGTPHAYINGNIVECMANSDNVVRAGLTNKYKDIDTLVEILDYKFGKQEIINLKQRKDEIIYLTTADEFEVSAFHKMENFRKKDYTNDRPVIILILEGMLQVEWKSRKSIETQQFKKGESFFIPASINQYSLSSEVEVKYFQVNIP